MKDLGTTVLLTLLLVCSNAGAEVRYHVTDLGVLDADKASYARAINNAGQVVGYSDPSDWPGSYINHGFLWQNGVMTALPGLSDASASKPADINNAGDIIGRCYSYDVSYRVMWADGGITKLTASDGPYACMSGASGINDAKQIVGSVESGGLYYAALWDNFTIRRLIDSSSSARAINNAGVIAGSMTVPGGYYGDEQHAVMITDNVVTDLGLLAYYQSDSRDINEADVIVGLSYTPSSTSWLAALWKENTYRNLGSLGGTRATAEAVNRWEQVVGFAWTTNNVARHAFLWDNGVMTDLNDLIDPTAGWELDTAYDINDLGQIVGYGTVGGQKRAFLLTPIPEPGTVTLTVLVCAAGLLLRRRR